MPAGVAEVPKVPAGFVARSGAESEPRRGGEKPAASHPARQGAPVISRRRRCGAVRRRVPPGPAAPRMGWDGMAPTQLPHPGRRSDQAGGRAGAPSRPGPTGPDPTRPGRARRSRWRTIRFHRGVTTPLQPPARSEWCAQQRRRRPERHASPTCDCTGHSP